MVRKRFDVAPKINVKDEGMLIQQATGSTANLFEIKDAYGNTLISFSSSGIMSTSVTPSFNGGISTTNINASGNVSVTGGTTLSSNTSIGNVSSIEISYLDGVTSNIQSQLDNKVGVANNAISQNQLSTSIPLSGVRNLIINGNMRINQRGVANVSTNNGVAVDRWAVSQSTAGAWVAQQATISSIAPLGGFDYAYKFTKTVGNTPGSGDYNYLAQSVEGNSISGLSWGTSAARPVSLSFWVYAGATGTFGGSIRTPGVTWWAYPFTYTINSINTWEYKTVSIPGPTSGTWPTDTNVGLSVFFDLGSGSTARLSGGSWQSGSNVVGASGTSQYPTTTTGGTWCITGIQLEQGSQATAFEQRPHMMELNLCRRYYYSSYPQGDIAGKNYSGTVITACGAPILLAKASESQQFNWVHNMRSAPTVTYYSLNGVSGSSSYAGSTSSTTYTDNAVAYSHSTINGWSATFNESGTNTGWYVAAHFVANADI